MIQKNYNLAALNTFGISCIAEQFAKLHSAEQLPALLAAAESPERVFLLGGGSNVLLPHRLSGLVLHNKIQFIDILGYDGDNVLLQVGGGVNWHELVLWSIGQGFSGIENMALIPGTVGASPIQNIGAYGVELKDVFESLEAVELASGKMQVFQKEDCHFGYRDSIFKTKLLAGKFCLSKIILRLKHTNHQFNTGYGAIQSQLASWKIEHPQARDVAAAVIEIRRSKLPDWRKYGNAGSFFKNPIVSTAQWQQLQSQYPNAPSYPISEQQVKLPAGWLIDQCGWKGKQEGPVGCYQHQALVIINHGGATGQDIVDFSDKVAASVLEKLGVTLEREVRLIQE